MKIGSMAWHERDDGASEVRCPLCAKVWLVNDEGEESDYAPCRHLRFVWGEYGIEYFGDWDRDGFERAYRAAAAQGCGEACELDEEAFDSFPDLSALETMRAAGVDEAFLLRDEGLEDPEARIEHYFGVKR